MGQNNRNKKAGEITRVRMRPLSVAMARKNRNKKAVIFGITSLILLWLVWVFAKPWICIASIDWLADKGDPESVTPMINGLVSSGSRAMPAILYGIRTHSFIAPPSSTVLILSLRGIGAPAKAGLAAAIDKETDQYTLLGYLYCYQMAFGDFSRIRRWAGPMAFWRRDSAIFLHFTLQEYFKDGVPDIVEDDGGTNGRFVDWYVEHMEPRGPLPRDGLVSITSG